jgi:metal-responsive CopG/Arc/MetJ family transcriptional regulator
MKTKTSVTLSAELLAEIDRKAGGAGSRSAFIEAVLLAHFRARSREAIESRDRRLLDAAADRLNREALDVLDYQSWNDDAAR